MKRLISQSFILLSFSSLGQPGDLNLSTTVKDSIEFIVLDSLGDTITSKNIDSKNFSISTIHLWGNDNWPCDIIKELLSKPCSIDSIGIAGNRDSVTLDLSYEYDKSIFWLRGAWIINVWHNDQDMTIYINGSGEEILETDSLSIYSVHFNPGNYYFLNEPTMYFKDGIPITVSLISLDETQPEELEKLFEYYHVREKLCM